MLEVRADVMVDREVHIRIPNGYNVRKQLKELGFKFDGSHWELKYALKATNAAEAKAEAGEFKKVVDALVNLGVKINKFGHVDALLAMAN